MAAPRGEFTSRFGFLMAASGSAVGLGNIWGFPTNAASNGGAAFLFTYLILAFALAYPALMAELIIGRYARANAVTALRTISSGNKTRLAALLVRPRPARRCGRRGAGRCSGCRGPWVE